MRAYEKTHPWITFDIQGLEKRLPASCWIALGEAQSKCEHLAGAPLQNDTALRLLKVYLAKGVAATTAIEGNTLSEDEVLQRIEGKLELPESQEYLGIEIDNIVKLWDEILNTVAAEGRTPLATGFVRYINKTILTDTEYDDDVDPGEYTRVTVGVRRYRGAPPEDLEYLMERYCAWLNSYEFSPPPGREVIYGILKSVIAHIYLVWIHPFGDGNGRTARVLELKFLLEAGVPSVAAHLLSNFYNLTRARYYAELERASKTGGEISSFIQYAVNGYVDQLRDQIGIVRQQQLALAWEDYVHDVLGRKKTITQQRRLEMVLALSRHGEPAGKSEIPDLNTTLAAMYAKRQEKAVSRDLNYCKELGLVSEIENKYIANKHIVAQFLPRGLGNEVPPRPDGTGMRIRQLKLPY